MFNVLNLLFSSDRYIAFSIPRLSLFFSRFSTFEKSLLAFWSPLHYSEAFPLLNANIMSEPSSAAFISRSLKSFSHEEALLYIPQLVQSLRFDQTNILRQFLLQFSTHDVIFSHYLLWNILTEKDHFVTENDNLPPILRALETEIIDQMTPEQHQLYEREFGFIDQLDLISQQLLPIDINKRTQALVDMLTQLQIAEGLYIPSNPNLRIMSIDAEHSVPLKSHARVPINITFKVCDEKDPELKIFPFSCIFKIQDDVRQDAMMIQFISLFTQIFEKAGLDTYMLPYRVFSTGHDRGVIQVITRATSRHDLGISTGEYLLNYFISKYGHPSSPSFIQARANYIKSLAPYSLLSYLFQVKDRHNANIMIDDDGHVVHIDFGFVFEISPGGNFKFERAPFKLTQEMIDLLGGSKEAAPFQEFSQLFIKCFFAVRACHEQIESVANLMIGAGFECFKANAIKNLHDRFFVDQIPSQVVHEILKLVDDSYLSQTTNAYDAFQSVQNKIFF